jgi:ABC-type lipoprotein export system ATPase subunit
MHVAEQYCDKLFEINNLTCQYKGKKTVLYVEDLIIERGKITAILGLSGIGKSTILETLGLMNNTIPKESKVLFYPHRDSEALNYSSLWYEKTEMIRSSVRRDHFSFIFQESNLMYNFTALDNIYITLLLQNEKKEKAYALVREYIRDMELDRKISDSTMIYNLSGGERQRISFIRAIAKDFTVLFGDEPTGNLDILNATRVLNSLSRVLKSNQKSAVIVTHDIKLSLEHADDIILIEERDEKNGGNISSYGYISGENIFKSSIIENKKVWKNHSATQEWHDNTWMTDEILRIFQKKQGSNKLY